MAINSIYWHERTMREPERVVGVEPGHASQFSFRDYEDLLRSGIFESAAGFRTSAMTAGSAPDVTRATVMVVTANFFEALGIGAARGRTFTAAEAAVVREPRVVVVTALVRDAPAGVGL